MTDIEAPDSIYGQDGPSGYAPFYGASRFMRRSCRRNLDGINFVGMDLVESAPDYDHAEITATIAAQLALEYLCLRASSRPQKG